VEVGDARLRFERTRARNEPRDPQSYESFLQEDEEEEALFHLSETLEKADIVIENKDTLDEFHQNIRENLIDGPLFNVCNPKGKELQR
jgi:dephospho-CoA kinase